MMNNKITIAMPYYEAPEMLRVHLDYWCKYPDHIAEQFSVVIVDDGSPNFPAEEVLKESSLPKFSIQLFRVDKNIPWNHGGARNLSMDRAPEGWVLTMDIDLVLDAMAAERLVEMELSPWKIYKPDRLDLINGEWTPAKRHPESFIMTRDMFWRVGGFDEDFTGYWNGPFTPFRKALKRTGRIEDLDNVYLKNHALLVEGAMVSEWGRRGSEYDVRTNPNMLRMRRIADRHYNPVNPLRFEWRQVI